jgi:hypothetical protein
MTRAQETTKYLRPFHLQLEVLLSDYDLLGLTPCMFQCASVLHTHEGEWTGEVEKRGSGTATAFGIMVDGRLKSRSRGYHPECT